DRALDQLGAGGPGEDDRGAVLIAFTKPKCHHEFRWTHHAVHLGGDPGHLTDLESLQQDPGVLLKVEHGRAQHVHGDPPLVPAPGNDKSSREHESRGQDQKPDQGVAPPLAQLHAFTTSACPLRTRTNRSTRLRSRVGSSWPVTNRVRRLPSAVSPPRATSSSSAATRSGRPSNGCSRITNSGSNARARAMAVRRRSS